MAVIVTFGELLAEFVAERIGQDFLEPGSFIGPFPSGAPAIFADQAARLGASVAYIGHIGEDAFGDAIVRRLQADGVDTSYIYRQSKLPTGTAFVAYAADGSRSFVYNISASASGLLDKASVPANVLANCRYLHVMGSTLNAPGAIAALKVLLEQARQHGVKISFDPNVRPEMLAFKPMADALREVFAQCHIFLPSEFDLKFFFPGMDVDEALASAFEQPKLEAVALKLGAGGSAYLERGKRLEAVPFVVDEVDPTGAGDCFGGTFVGALALGFDSAEALQLANAAGALAVTRRGPMEGNSDLPRITRFLQEGQRNAKCTA